MAISREMVMFANNNDLAILPDAKGWTNRFEIKSSSSDRLYVIAYQPSTDTWGCGCRGWIRHRHCKHIDPLITTLRKITTQRAETTTPVRKIGGRK